MLADWQEVWHSPQPPVFAEASSSRELKVLILSIFKNLLVRKYITNLMYHISYGLSNIFIIFKGFFLRIEIIAFKILDSL